MLLFADIIATFSVHASRHTSASAVLSVSTCSINLPTAMWLSARLQMFVFEVAIYVILAIYSPNAPLIAASAFARISTMVSVSEIPNWIARAWWVSDNL